MPYIALLCLWPSWLCFVFLTLLLVPLPPLILSSISVGGISAFFLTDWLCTCGGPRLCSALTSRLLLLFFLFRAPLCALSQLNVLFKLSFLFVLRTISFLISLLILYTFSLKGISVTLSALWWPPWGWIFVLLFILFIAVPLPYLMHISFLSILFNNRHMVVRRFMCLLRLFCSGPHGSSFLCSILLFLAPNLSFSLGLGFSSLLYLSPIGTLCIYLYIYIYIYIYIYTYLYNKLIPNIICFPDLPQGHCPGNVNCGSVAGGGRDRCVSILL
jgi:hypothetical protein